MTNKVASVDDIISTARRFFQDGPATHISVIADKQQLLNSEGYSLVRMTFNFAVPPGKKPAHKRVTGKRALFGPIEFIVTVDREEGVDDSLRAQMDQIRGGLRAKGVDAYYETTLTVMGAMAFTNLYHRPNNGPAKNI